MDRIERGTRNLEKLRSITTRKGRGQLTLWNPTAAKTYSHTVWATDAGLLVQVYDALSDGAAHSYLELIATASGYLRALEFAWSHAFRR
jgi:hypothetical protein